MRGEGGDALHDGRIRRVDLARGHEVGLGAVLADQLVAAHPVVRELHESLHADGGQLVGPDRRLERTAHRVHGADRLAGLPLLCAHLFELAHEEFEARVIRAHGADGIHGAREPRHVLFHQRALGLHDEFVGDAVDAPAREVIRGIACEHGAVELERVLARRFGERALGERKSGGVQRLLDARLVGVARRPDRRGGFRRLRAADAVPRLPAHEAPGGQHDRDYEEAAAAPAAREAFVELEFDRRRQHRQFGGATEELALVARRQRRGEVPAVSPALRRVHEIADALGRGWLVQEAEDHAFRDEWRELVLVVAAAGDDDREVRKLRVDFCDQVLGVVVGKRGIDEEHRIAGGDHEVGRVRRIVGAPDTVNAGEGLAQQVDEHRIGGEHDDVRAHRARRRLCGRLRGRLHGRRRLHCNVWQRLRLRIQRIVRIRCVVTRQDVRIIDVHWPP